MVWSAPRFFILTLVVCSQGFPSARVALLFFASLPLFSFPLFLLSSVTSSARRLGLDSCSPLGFFFLFSRGSCPRGVGYVWFCLSFFAFWCLGSVCFAGSPLLFVASSSFVLARFRCSRSLFLVAAWSFFKRACWLGSFLLLLFGAVGSGCGLFALSGFCVLSLGCCSCSAGWLPAVAGFGLVFCPSLYFKKEFVMQNKCFYQADDWVASDIIHTLAMVKRLWLVQASGSPTEQREAEILRLLKDAQSDITAVLNQF